MDAAQAHYNSAEAQLSYAQVRSPINGVIADRPLNVGEMASAGSALLTVVDISRVVARANVPRAGFGFAHEGRAGRRRSVRARTARAR